MGFAKDLSGLRFGRLLVQRFDHNNKYGQSIWLCLCDCGKSKAISGNDLSTGNSKSCGCFALEIRTKHGKSKTRTYRVWEAMIGRCHNPLNPVFDYYGGRGIFVCDQWRESFEAFFSEMGDAPSRLHTIDRRDNSKGYVPGNCHWATKAQQSRNTRRNVWLTYKGQRLCQKDWCDRLGIKSQTMIRRRRMGWSIEEMATYYGLKQVA